MKKHIKLAELDIIHLETADLLTSSPNTPGVDPEGSFGNEDGVGAPSRNYRGVEKGYEDEEW